MQKYGRQRQHHHGYPDNHPKKGKVNWWEVEFHDGKSKKTARQDSQKEMKEDIGFIMDTVRKQEP